ncbi:HU domain-containing protein [Mucilaginibacter boryungensis]|uniref:SPOR domain-containing protein n=1 Tax=Mucilaginibacter boryungensis TaxID=768480 RepID=A0ABR9XFF7_9SPHI|nr:SPOR domain-containing protein [Mucilaginibacter boryungensis]MBE9665902.1 SPOR domain-containing protein [Mucilaginibacter boryungensis]
MDIAYYISDLLGQQGELTVPNLGYFVQIRTAAYYDNHEKKFYPPHYSVQFDPQIIDEDDSLANYIASIKNISQASAKYFIEKYISNLKSQAMVENVAFAQLGSFSSDGLKLAFHSNPKLDDPAFFGYKPLDAYRVGEAAAQKPVTRTDELTEKIEEGPIAPVIETHAPIITQPDTDLPVETEVPAEEYYEDERRGMSVWLIILIAFTVIVIALGALYKFRPDTFNKYVSLLNKSNTTQAPKPVVTKKADNDTLQLKEPVIIDDSTAQADTSTASAKQPGVKKTETVTEVKKPAVVTQTPVANTPQATAPPVNTTVGDVVPKGSWVIYSLTFPTRSQADKRIVELKSKGFTEARLLTDKVFRGGNYKVILGAFKTRAEAMDKRTELLGTNKLRASELSVEPYK